MDEKIFEQSVLITAAFIQNGDIRSCGKFDNDSNTVAQIRDLVESTYKALSEAKRSIQDSSEI